MKRRLGIGSASVVGFLCVVTAVGFLVPVSGTAKPQARVCSATEPAASASRVWLEAAPRAPGDTLWVVHVCQRPADGKRIGSFHLAMQYDSSALRAARIVQPSSGSVVANLRRPGHAEVAGADPHGFAPGQLVEVVFRCAEPTSGANELPSDVRLRVLELNAVTGASMLGSLGVTGLGTPSHAWERPSERHTPRTAAQPHVDSIVPSHVLFMGPGELVRMMIHGSGFQATGNVVLLAGTAIAEIPSPDGQTLRLILPDHFPGHGEVAPRMITAGRYEIRVRTATGTSNGMVFTVGTPP